MTENTTEEMPEDGRVLAALGVNPANVKAGSFAIHYDGQGGPLIQFTILQRVSTGTLARAMLIATTPEAASAPGEDVSRETSPVSRETSDDDTPQTPQTPEPPRVANLASVKHENADGEES